MINCIINYQSQSEGNARLCATSSINKYHITRDQEPIKQIHLIWKLGWLSYLNSEFKGIEVENGAHRKLKGIECKSRGFWRHIFPVEGQFVEIFGLMDVHQKHHKLKQHHRVCDRGRGDRMCSAVSKAN